MSDDLIGFLTVIAIYALIGVWLWSLGNMTKDTNDE